MASNSHFFVCDSKSFCTIVLVIHKKLVDDSVTYKINSTKLTSLELEMDNLNKDLYQEADDYSTCGNVK